MNQACAQQKPGTWTQRSRKKVVLFIEIMACLLNVQRVWTELFTLSVQIQQVQMGGLPLRAGQCMLLL